MSRRSCEKADSDVVRLRVCISIGLPGEADAAGTEATLQVTRTWNPTQTQGP